MIDPYNITNFNRSNSELEEFLLFCIAVAGKKATNIAKALEIFLNIEINDLSPFEKIKKYIEKNTLKEYLIKSKIGKYKLLEKSYSLLVNKNFDLKIVSVDDLEKIPGIGKKTSRFFIVHSRKTKEYSILDTHVRKWLSNIGYNISNNWNKEYEKLEKIFINESKLRNLEIHDLDLKIWSAYSKKQSLENIIPFHNKRLYNEL